MRFGSVMSVIDVIQPVWWPLASTRGDTYSRASNRLPSLRLTRTWNPPTVVRPASSSSSLAASWSRSASGQYGKGGVRPTSSASLQPVIWQNAAFTYVMWPCMSSARMPVSIEFSIARRKLVSATRACCACMRRRVCRQLPISIQAVITLRVPTSQNRPLPITPSDVL